MRMFRRGEKVAREIGKSHTTLTGEFPATKDGLFKAFESPLERDFLVILDFDWAVHSFHPQPVTIGYRDPDGQERRYTPDVLVTFRRDRPDFAKRKNLLAEIKTELDLKHNAEAYRVKFKAAEEYAAARNWEFKVLTEREIRTPYLKNANFLRQFRLHPSNPYLYNLLRDAANAVEEGTPEEILEDASELLRLDPDNYQYRDLAPEEIRAALLPNLWRLLDDGFVGCDLTRPLTMETRLWVQEEPNGINWMSGTW